MKYKMKRLDEITTKVVIGLLLVGLSVSCGKEAQSSGKVDLTGYVNPFIGTAGYGHCFPAACLPFGFVQPGPITGNSTWDYCSGYQYRDTTLSGFAQNHLNGTGCPDLGDILLVPLAGEHENRGTSAIMDKSKEKATPGYYQVYLKDRQVNAEMTASEHVAYYRYDYQSTDQPGLLVDFQFGTVSDTTGLHTHVTGFEVSVESNCRMTGVLKTNWWVERNCYFVVEFNKPFVRKKVLPKQDSRELADRYILEFEGNEEPLEVKVALSTVSVDGARANMRREITAWDFDAVCKAAKEKWNNALASVSVEGTNTEKTNVYTSLYHLMLQPNNIADVDGRFRGSDNEVKTSGDSVYYSTLSLWDTFRAAHPLYTILMPDLAGKFVGSIVQHQQASGYLPIWELWGKENHCMIGNHAVPVIVDAYLKGIKGFNPDMAYEAIYKSLTENHSKSDWTIYNKYGYYPFDLIPEESVSRTMESCYDDYCAALMARSLGKTAEAEFFMKRSGFWQNMFDPSTALVRGKDAKGDWRTPFSPLRLSHAGTSGGDYTEGNAWQYTWHVLHDVPGLINRIGGKDRFINKLDSLFLLNPDTENSGFVLDVTGLIGQYAHGNEPSHHVPYLYTLAGRPDKTAELVREIIDRFYLDKPDGLCGNDDCGQMSAWYIFSVMGFYPLNPCGGEFILGAPQLRETTLFLQNGKSFKVVADQLSRENKYVQSVKLNGKPVSDHRITYQDIMNGGELEFKMGKIATKY